MSLPPVWVVNSELQVHCTFLLEATPAWRFAFFSASGPSGHLADRVPPRFQRWYWLLVGRVNSSPLSRSKRYSARPGDRDDRPRCTAVHRSIHAPLWRNPTGHRGPPVRAGGAECPGGGAPSHGTYRRQPTGVVPGGKGG